MKDHEDSRFMPTTSAILDDGETSSQQTPCVTRCADYLPMTKNSKCSRFLKNLSKSALTASSIPSKKFVCSGYALYSAFISLVSVSLLVLIVYRGFLSLQRVEVTAIQFNTRGEKPHTISLADGSQLTLSENTHLRSKFTKDQRWIWLDCGEVTIDVAQDTHRPFVIMTGEQRITVVGTRFSIRRDTDCAHASASANEVAQAKNKTID